ncbi:juvenile hormone esterase isoform X3 [Spodoptera frugiperda]|uniref:Carboxylic ester hydrolase n=1 Tax=Spodoptera frugiperda TaxID=7108 RepID=A0A9R0CZ30_SPOFR|nr:juvenile hormone esterase isoform X3 [Spodoptera frugiperda]
MSRVSRNLPMPLVKTVQGELKGVVCHDTVSYVTFKGIPYAKPPLGELRFKAPEPPEPWEGVRDASQHGPVCPQYNERMNRVEAGSEDCLYLNVYTKTLTPPSPLPVMVWIHGGGFYTGSGDSDFYGPEFFMEHDVILVTINYRLEVLGFLCLDTEEVPGNAGMKDQVLALKWVKQNIAAFGGDPNNVTIFGCSAGSASVSCHLVSKMSEGLFNKAICQSGVCLNEWSYNLYARQRAFQLGKLLGKDTDDPKELLEFLRSVPATSLISIQLPLLELKYNDLLDSILFGPVIEKVGSDKNKFLSDMPIELVKNGHMAKVPLILGFTSGDGIEIARKLPHIAGFLTTPGAVVPRELKLKWEPEKVQKADERIRKHYFQDKPISMEEIQQYSDFETDRVFLYNIVRYARYHLQYASEPVYFYEFVAETERNFTKKSYNMDSLKGVCHSDELPYLFNVTCIDIPLSDESIDIIKQFVRLWTNFASTGKPTQSGGEEWKPFKEDERNYYIIGKTLQCKKDPRKDNITFWEDIYEESQLNVNKQ